jgi:ABC-type nickel/cobalt efflux system permease component RcnA
LTQSPRSKDFAVDAALVELLVSFGIVLGLACWELYRVNRELRRDRERAADKEDNAA